VYRRLLVPVCEAAEVEPLLRFGATLLEPDGEIRVLYVIPTTTLPQVTREWRESIHIVVPAHETGAALDIRVDPEVRAGTDVAREILQSAESHGTEAILMTLRGGRKIRGTIFGHVSSALLHHATCDVVIVNRIALVTDRVPRILIPTFRPAVPPKLLKLAEEIAVAQKGVPIVTLTLAARGRSGHVPGEPRTPRGVPMEHRRSFISSALLGHRARLPELILQEAARERFGLLLVGEEAMHPEGSVLTRRFLEELFRGAPCPVLAVKG
jgi:nucleotide-binding universal stress UspA family protein